MTALLEVKELTKHFTVKGGLLSPKRILRAVDGVSFELAEGKTLGLVGESGCGKSTLGRAILQLHSPSSGAVVFEGKEVTGASKKELKRLRQNMQIIFQDPYGSLNPRMTVLEIVREPLDTHKIGTKAERREKVESLLELVGLRRHVLSRYPHEFSGGQRQRIGIARALALNPKFIVADEPVSALDVSVQAQVLNLISELQKKLGISFLFIAHDLAVVQHISHEVGVMYLGRLVEKASAKAIYTNACHPYTQALLSAVPKPHPKKKAERMVLTGDVPSPINPPSGCPFHPRCPQVKDICRRERPKVVDLGAAGDEHLVSCHLYG